MTAAAVLEAPPAAPVPLEARRLALESAAWRRHVAGDPAGLPFHEPAWSRTLASAYGLRHFLLGAAGADGGVAAGLPVIETSDPVRGRRWIGLPFTDVCPPLVAPGVDWADAIRSFDERRRVAGARVLEIRTAIDSTLAAPMDAGVIHELELERDADAVFRSFRSQTQRNIRKAVRSGVSIEASRSEHDLLDVFYGLHLRTRRRQGIPVQPKRFFHALRTHMLGAGHGFVLVARLDGRPVAAAVFLTGGGTIVYKFGASDPSFLAARPNNLLFWEAIRWGCEHGYRHFNFGRSDHENAGLRSFKSGWGAEERPLVYSLLTDDAGAAPRAYPARPGRAVRKAITAAPLAVCRLLGEALYRYAA